MLAGLVRLNADSPLGTNAHAQIRPERVDGGVNLCDQPSGVSSIAFRAWPITSQTALLEKVATIERGRPTVKRHCMACRGFVLVPLPPRVGDMRVMRFEE